MFGILGGEAAGVDVDVDVDAVDGGVRWGSELTLTFVRASKMGSLRTMVCVCRWYCLFLKRMRRGSLELARGNVTDRIRPFWGLADLGRCPRRLRTSHSQSGL